VEVSLIGDERETPVDDMKVAVKNFKGLSGHDSLFYRVI